MTKYEWETELKKNIHRLPDDEIARVMEYYGELFADMIERGKKETEIISEFGNPVDVADIRYAVYQNRVLSIHTGEESIEISNLPLKKFLGQVRDAVFLSPMKGVAVNIAYIESVDYVNQYIYLKGISEPVSMGSVLKKRFRSEYEKYVRRGYKQ